MQTERADVQGALLATQGVQVYFHFLPTTEHANGRKEASRRYNSILLPNDLAIPGEEDLVWGWGNKREAQRAKTMTGDKPPHIRGWMAGEGTSRKYYSLWG